MADVSTSTPSPTGGHATTSSSSTSGWVLVLVACIALTGVLTTAGIQWWVGRRTSAALKESAEAARANSEAAKSNAEAARVSAEAASRSAQTAQDAVGVNAESAAGIARRAEADAFAKRYQDAAAQIGHEKAPVRLAGVYAMARLADDWAEQRQTCVDVLCAYVRMPPGAMISTTHDGSDELQVRLAIFEAITTHLTGTWGRPWHLDRLRHQSGRCVGSGGGVLVSSLQRPRHV